MFKTTDKINRAIGILRNVTEELKDTERQNHALSIVHDLSTLLADCLSDLKKTP